VKISIEIFPVYGLNYIIHYYFYNTLLFYYLFSPMDATLKVVVSSFGEAYGSIRLRPDGTELNMRTVWRLAETAHLAYFTEHVWHHVVVVPADDGALHAFHLAPGVNVEYLPLEELFGRANLTMNSRIVQIHHEDHIEYCYVVAVAMAVKVAFELAKITYDLTKTNCEQFANFCFTLRYK
jgi:hypothetical protein